MVAQSNQGAVETAHRISRHFAQDVRVSGDPRWSARRRGIDPETGQARQQLLDAAIARGDSAGVTAFYEDYLRARTIEGPPPYRQPEDKPFYRRDEIRELYARHRRGEITGADWGRLEREIIAAGREGRVWNPESLSVNGWSGK